MPIITVLNKGNVPIGPFTRTEIAERLRSGEIALTDLAFIEGLAQWTPLGEVLTRVDAAIPPASGPAVVTELRVFQAPAAATPNAPAYSYAATMEPPPHLVYGGFWLRFAAHLIDAVVVVVPVLILIFGVGCVLGTIAAAGQIGFGSHGGRMHGDQPNPLLMLGIMVFNLGLVAVLVTGAWLYYAMMESGPSQGTVGKRVMGLKVIDVQGRRISFGRATGRYFAKIITSMVPFLIGYMMAGFTDRKQALHDLIAATLVVRG